MQIVFTSDVNTGSFRYEAGWSYDVDQAQAARFIAQGVARLPSSSEGDGGPLQALVSGAGNLTNFSRAYYKNYRKALGELRAGVRGNLPVLCIGDSTTQGSNGLTPANSIQNAWPRRLADLLTGQGLQSGWQNCFGDHQTVGSQSSTIQANDPRVSAFPAGWTYSVSGFGLAGPGPGGQFFANNSTTNPLTFTPTVPTDTCEVYYLDVNGYDPFLVKSGAAGATAPSTGGTASITGTSLVKKLTSTYTLGNNVWTVQRAGTGTNCFIVGISCYDSTKPEMSFINMGCGSQRVAYWTASTNFWDAYRQLTDTNGAITGAPLAIINVGINDWIQGTSPTAFATSLTTLVAGLQAKGTDVLLVVPVPTASATASLAAQAAIAQQIYNVAASQGCAVLDLTQRWVSAADSASLYGDSGVHPSYAGYVDVAQAVAGFFRQM